MRHGWTCVNSPLLPFFYTSNFTLLFLAKLDSNHCYFGSSPYLCPTIRSEQVASSHNKLERSATLHLACWTFIFEGSGCQQSLMLTCLESVRSRRRMPAKLPTGSVGVLGRLLGCGTSLDIQPDLTKMTHLWRLPRHV